MPTDPSELTTTEREAMKLLNESAPGDRGNDSEGQASTGRPMRVDSIAQLLTDIETQIRRFCVLPCDEAYVAAALWVATTYVVHFLDIAPGLVITSIRMRSGKSRLLEVLAGMACRPERTVNISAAVFFRVLSDQSKRPTFFVDEADGIFGANAKKLHEDIRTLINSCHTRGQTAMRMGGANYTTVERFETFSMVCLAGIDRMPSTIEDRAVVLRLDRARADQAHEAFRYRCVAEFLTPIAEALKEWADAFGEQIRDVKVDSPLADRAADTWEPLLALATLAGPEWQARALAAAVELTRRYQAENAGLTKDERLLVGVGEVLRSRSLTTGFIGTTELVNALCADEESEWGSDTLTAQKLAGALKKFGLQSRPNSTSTFRGFRVSDLLEAIDRNIESDGSDGLDGFSTSAFAQPHKAV